MALPLLSRDDAHYFIEAGFAGSSKETATLLVGTAREFDIDQHDIEKIQGGFRISEALYTVLYDEGVFDNKTSGNRAAKKTSPKEKP